VFGVCFFINKLHINHGDKMASTSKKSITQFLSKFNSSGINITPSALKLLQELPISWNDVAKFIQKISFDPDFNSLVTREWIQKEFGKMGSNSQIKTSETQEIKFQLKEKGYGNPDNTCQATQSISQIQNQPEDEMDADLLNIMEDELPEPPDSPDFPDIMSNDDLPSTPNGETNRDSIVSPVTPEIPLNNLKNSPPPSDDSSNELQSSINSIDGSNPESSSDLDEIERIRAAKRKDWENIIHQSGTSTFHPIASDYDGDIKILKDPTGSLYTEGKIDEFINLINDKFEILKSILKKRPESNDLYEINMINRLESSVEVNFIGMVTEKRQTKNRNIILQFEDQTGTCTVLVRPKPEVLFNYMSHLLPDQVVIVEGYLSVHQEKKSRIIIANNIIFPDSPNKPVVKGTQEDLGICLISDTHFGSKDWLEKVWHRFVKYLNCKMGSDKQVKQAGKIKYLCIAGDIVDGIGIYPNQDKRLSITDIYDQYQACANYFSEIPDYIEIIVSPGDHDAVRKAIPAPALAKDIAAPLYADPRVTMVGCPALVSLHGITTQIFHGTSLIDLNMSIPGMTNEDPVKTMREFFLARHLAPTFGKKTEIAPLNKDWLVLDPLPDILHTGHLHKNGCGWYHGALLINSGCFQGQTDFMDNLGIEPDFGKPTIVYTKDKLTPQVIDLIGDY
jgi:DNA polymerase II small subunit